MHEIKFRIKDWYEIHNGFTISIKPGYTALIGPNGAGKTTLLDQIDEKCKSRNIDVLNYSNFRNGGHEAISAAGFRGDMRTMIAGLTLSEGQNIIHNFGNLLSRVRMTVDKAVETQKPFLLLLDSLDSGASLDSIENIKGAFEAILEDASTKNGGENNLVYIVNAANDYSFVSKDGENIDVRTGKKIEFPNFEAYQKFIIEYRKTHPDM